MKTRGAGVQTLAFCVRRRDLPRLIAHENMILKALLPTREADHPESKRIPEREQRGKIATDHQSF